MNTSLTNSGTVNYANANVTVVWSAPAPSAQSATQTYTYGPLTAGSTVNLPTAGTVMPIGTDNGGTVTMSFYADAAQTQLIATLTFTNVIKGTTRNPA